MDESTSSAGGSRPAGVPVPEPDGHGWYAFGPVHGWVGAVAAYSLLTLAGLAVAGYWVFGVTGAIVAVVVEGVVFAVLLAGAVLETRMRLGRLEQRRLGRRSRFAVDGTWQVRSHRVELRPDDVGREGPPAVQLLDPSGAVRASWNVRGGPSASDAARILGVTEGAPSSEMPLTSRRPWLVITIVISALVVGGIFLVWFTQSGCCI